MSDFIGCVQTGKFNVYACRYFYLFMLITVDAGAAATNFGRV